MNSPRILQAYCQIRTSPSKGQSFVKELAKPTKDEIILKNPNLSEKQKYAMHSRYDNDTKTQH